MNGKKRKNKKLDLDLGKNSQFLEVIFASNNFNMNRFFTLKIIIYDLHFLERN